MKDSFTLNDFILFNNESDKNEDDMECYHKYAGGSLMAPDKRIIANILSYSRALSVIKTEKAGTLNLLMN